MAALLVPSAARAAVAAAIVGKIRSRVALHALPTDGSVPTKTDSSQLMLNLVPSDVTVASTTTPALPTCCCAAVVESLAAVAIEATKIGMTW